jgi:hypothetical protein
MLDDFREQADAGSFFDDFEEEEVRESLSQRALAPLAREKLFGTTPIQRLILVLMLLVTTFLVSALCLLVTGKIVFF